MRKILQTPARYAQEIYDSYLTPSASYVLIIIELARLKPALPEDYIEDVARELRKLIDG